MTQTIHDLQHKQLVRIQEYRHTLFRVGSIEGMARCALAIKAAYAQSPQVELEFNATRRQRGFEAGDIAWLSPMAAVLTSSKAYQEQQKQEWDSAVILKLGDKVRVEGRVYTIQAAANDNVFLFTKRPVYGHPTINRYPDNSLRRVVR